jgi:uncharacterized protein (TIGR00369 family)
MTENSTMSAEAMNDRLRASPFSRWLGIQVVSFERETLNFEMCWREEFSGTPDNDNAHGGILAALLDTACGYACATRYGKPLTTVDLRIDYHRPAPGKVLKIESRVIKSGKRLATAEASVLSENGELLASGRGLFVV